MTVAVAATAAAAVVAVPHAPTGGLEVSGHFCFFSLLPSKDEPALQGYFAEQMTRDFNKWKPKEMLFAGDDLWQPTEQHDLAHFEPSVAPFRSKEQTSK